MVTIDTLNEYLFKNNIMVKDSYFKSFKSINDEEILNQISLISEVDRVLTSYSSIGYARLYSVIGKRVENFKVQLRRLKVDLENREEKECKNEVDIFLLDKGNNILKKGWEILRLLDNTNYISLINRSMNLNEICLGKTDESNLRISENIEIGKLKNASYNIREEDIYVYLKKIKLKNRNLNVDKYIDEFITINKLQNNSKEYIKMLLLFPSATLKQWNRYKDRKKNISSEEYLINIKKAFEYEI